MRYLLPWWRNGSMLLRLSALAEELLYVAGEYDARVTAHGIRKSGLACLLLEIEGPYPLDGRAAQVLKEELVARIPAKLKRPLTLDQVVISLVHARQKLRTSLEEELLRCRDGAGGSHPQGYEETHPVELSEVVSG